MRCCRLCGMLLKKKWKYCPNCGMHLEKEEKTFAEVYEEWEKRYREKISRSTLNCYRAAKKYYEPLFGRAFSRIDLTDLQRCVDECKRGKRTRENMKALSGLMYKYALPRHLSDMNYAMYLETGVNDKKSYSPFSAGQIETIRGAIGKIPYAEEIYVLIYTGFRPAELFELQKSAYRRIEGISCLIGGIKTNAGRDRVVTVSPRIRDIIDRKAQGDSPWLFPDGQGRKMNTKVFREKCFYPALEEMGIQLRPLPGTRPRYVPYSCRHTFSNLLKNVTGSDRDKADLMGHTDYQTTKRIYQSAELLAKKAITDRL